jgi:hypothetical protein
LFVYNPNLEVIDLSHNQIANIDPDVFDYLNSLRFLNIETNECISDMENDRNGVKALITEIKEKCNNCDYELQKNLQKSCNNDKNSLLAQIDDLSAELDMIRAQSDEKRKHDQVWIEKLSKRIEKCNIQHAEDNAYKDHRILLLTTMLVIMCTLLIIFTAIIICFILSKKSSNDEEPMTPEIVEYLPRYDENIIVKRTHRQKRLSENLYEDINGSIYVIESGERQKIWNFIFCSNLGYF